MYNPTAKLETPDDFLFPYTPYEIQQQLMRSVYKLIENRGIGIFESPTGTGKSLTLTCAALRWLTDHEELVKNELTERINNLQRTIQDFDSFNSSDDINWISEQSILINQQTEFKDLCALKDLISQQENFIEKIYSRQKNKSVVCNPSNSSETIKETIKSTMTTSFKSNIEKLVSHNVKIYFCSRTHSQLSQVVKEIKSTSYGKRIRCVTLASRQHLCIHPKLQKMKSSSQINAYCLDMVRKETKRQTEATINRCPFRRTDKMENLAEVLLSEISGVEDTVARSKCENACPYYASRRAAKLAQLILLPYQMLLHQKTRKQAGIDLKNSIIIIDEAHNLLDSIIQINSCKITLEDLTLSSTQIMLYKNKYLNMISAKNLLCINQLLFVIKQLRKMISKPSRYNLLRTYEISELGQFFNIDMANILKFCEETKFAQKLQVYVERNNENLNGDVSIKNENFQSFLQNVETVNQTSESQCENNLKNITNETAVAKPYLQSILQFLECLGDDADYGRVLINAGDKNNAFIKYILLNAGEYFHNIINEARAIIIAGGTMQPTNELKQQLFCSCIDKVEEHIYDHVVPIEAVQSFAVIKGPSKKTLSFTYANRNSLDVVDELGSILVKLSIHIPAGLICFFPSYEYLEYVYQHLYVTKSLEKISERKRVIREKNSTGDSIESLLKEYASAVKQNGALLFCVVGGNLSEGLNFADDLGRGVIVVGLPYPNKSSIELQQRMNYLDQRLGKGAGDEFYENICMKSINQCIGRSVRHLNDYSCVYLLDERYGNEKIKRKLPKWILRSFRSSINFENLEAATINFFKSKEKIKIEIND